jgi:hypothetical protein
MPGRKPANAGCGGSRLRRPPPPSRCTAAGRLALSALPTQGTVVFERFFDEVSDTHLVILHMVRA